MRREGGRGGEEIYMHHLWWKRTNMQRAKLDGSSNYERLASGSLSAVPLTTRRVILIDNFFALKNMAVFWPIDCPTDWPTDRISTWEKNWPIDEQVDRYTDNRHNVVWLTNTPQYSTPHRLALPVRGIVRLPSRSIYLFERVSVSPIV